ncbi:pirin family protein [Pasteurella dagmatis]|uniref:Pirin family protein n=1 Tax=Pasteurella dagmatis ATCC 43325 TaxID=667128 RepID=C9PNA8_9PAST|nr:pirin family protein [Pasteurella dagmatis]EEX50895.1 pirin family protein [Pasteurella dagmatis ATCC 43325]SNV72765.1 pirin-like protein [Pasteurella dagmatis]
MSIDKFTALTKDVGGIPVARLLPKSSKKTIGAWCFLDHAGPAEFSQESDGLQVGSHPHTNLQTFTWMLSGEVWHQDSLGFRQLIRPKQVNLMTAGTNNYGICHTEQTPENVKDLHAVQLWIALPMNKEIKPNFEHYPTLPEWSEEGINFILTTGSFAGHTAPTTQFSPLLGLDVQFTKKTSLTVKVENGWEYGALVIGGTLRVNGEEYQQDELAVLTACDEHGTFTLEGEEGCHLMLLGGEPLPHPTVIWWNFVADKAETLKQAVEDWNNNHPRFGHINLEGTKLKRLIAPRVPEKLK